MEYRGYDERFRFATVKMAVNRHKRRVENWERGEGVYEDYRTDGERAEAAASKRDWYKRDGKHHSVMFVQPTENSQLKKMVQVAARKNGIKVKVVERAGQTVKKVLQRSNPFGRIVCGRDTCMVCRHGKPGECRERGCVYELICREDERKYRGQTSRSVGARFVEEMRDWENQESHSPLWRHSELYHGGQEFEVGVKVIKNCFGKPSRRMISEAVMIEQLRNNETMNSKREWTFTKLNKVFVA